MTHNNTMTTTQSQVTTKTPEELEQLSEDLWVAASQVLENENDDDFVFILTRRVRL